MHLSSIRSVALSATMALSLSLSAGRIVLVSNEKLVVSFLTALVPLGLTLSAYKWYRPTSKIAARLRRSVLPMKALVTLIKMKVVATTVTVSIVLMRSQ